MDMDTSTYIKLQEEFETAHSAGRSAEWLSCSGSASGLWRHGERNWICPGDQGEDAAKTSRMSIKAMSGRQKRFCRGEAD